MMNECNHVGVLGLHWTKFTLFPLGSAEYQPAPEVNLPNNKTENGQANVKER